MFLNRVDFLHTTLLFQQCVLFLVVFDIVLGIVFGIVFGVVFDCASLVFCCVDVLLSLGLPLVVTGGHRRGWLCFQFPLHVVQCRRKHLLRRHQHGSQCFDLILSLALRCVYFYVFGQQILPLRFQFRHTFFNFSPV